MNNYILPIVQYLLSPAITVLIFWYVLQKVYKLGELNEKFSSMFDDVTYLKGKVDVMWEHLIIIKTYLISKSDLDSNVFNHNSNKSEAN